MRTAQKFWLVNKKIHSYLNDWSKKIAPKIQSAYFIVWKCFNRQYMTNSTLVSPVKMEYGWNFSISGLKMMMKSGLGKIFLKFLHALTMSFLLLNFDQKYKFTNKNNMVSAWRKFKNIFPRPLFIIIFRPEILKFHPYSILTGDIRVEFVIYCVLRRCYWEIVCQ